MDATQRQMVIQRIRQMFINPEATIRHLVTQSHWQVYEFIQKTYPREFQNIMPGLSQNADMRRRLEEFLVKKLNIARRHSQQAAEEWEIYFLQNTEKK